MRPTESQGENTGPGLAADFATRQPSQSWERVEFPDDSQNFLWVWFKPQGVPHGFVVRLPDEAWQNQPQPEQWTMRRLLQPIGVEPQSVSLWQLYGIAYDGMQGTSPLFDQAIPSPSPGMDSSIFVYVNVPQVAPMQQAVPLPTANVNTDNVSTDVETLERIEADWNAIQETENEVKGLRKNIIDMASRLKTLNRDLLFEEREHADSMDTRDWRDARRALRDSSLKLSVCLKEVDIGDVSSGEQRAWFEQIFRQFVVPRVEFENMPQAEISFSYQRKMLAMLQSNMNTALLHAVNVGERPAQKILDRIGAKIRDAQTKRNFLGVMFD